jgi:hypothetical protein
VDAQQRQAGDVERSVSVGVSRPSRACQ